jgi:hypothetical protein
MEENTGKTLVKRNPDGTFPKGVSGNPSGPGKGYKWMTTKIVDALEKISDGNGDSNSVAIAKALVEGAKRGEDRKIEIIMKYVDGEPKRDDDLGSAGNPIHHVLHHVVWN